MRCWTIAHVLGLENSSIICILVCFIILSVKPAMRMCLQHALFTWHKGKGKTIKRRSGLSCKRWRLHKAGRAAQSGNPTFVSHSLCCHWKPAVWIGFRLAEQTLQGPTFCLLLLSLTQYQSRGIPHVTFQWQCSFKHLSKSDQFKCQPAIAGKVQLTTLKGRIAACNFVCYSWIPLQPFLIHVILAHLKALHISPDMHNLHPVATSHRHLLT